MKVYQTMGLWILIAVSVGATGCGSSPSDTQTPPPSGGNAGSGPGGAGSGSGAAGGVGGTSSAGGSTSTGDPGGTGGAVCNPSTPAILSPMPGTTVPGGSITLQWSGGMSPYQVEVAFDAAFNDPVTPPITTGDQSVTVDGLNGGYFYWRVRSLGGCEASEPTAPAELHATCKPIKLASSLGLSYYASAIAWNAKDREYGIVYTRFEGGAHHIVFVRTDRLGNTIFGPMELTGPLMPDPSTGGYQNPTLAYVASMDRWATAYHREGADQSYVTLFDDSGGVLATQALDDGSDSEAQSVSYEPDLDRIVTSTDHGGAPWNTYVQQFDVSLNPVGTSVSASNCTASPYDGAFGGAITLPGLSGQGPAALALFDYRESFPPGVHDLFAQRVDLTTGALAWDNGANECAGRQIVPSLGPDLSIFPSMDWKPDEENVGVAYNVHPPANISADVYFTMIDPKSGSVLTPPTLLNTGAPKKAFTAQPKVAWDGEEFLAMWNDGRDQNQYGQIRMTKLDAAGNVIGSGDALFPLDGWVNWIPNWAGRGLVGHDRIHTFLIRHQQMNGAPSEVWMCIEPAYP